MKKLVALVFLTSAIKAQSQNLAAYTNYRNQLVVFDSGINYQIEHNRVESFKVGGTMVAYIDLLENFKLFYKGETQTLERVPIGMYEATDYLIAYTLNIGNVLYVVDAGKAKMLTTIAGYYSVSDSTVVFYDRLKQSFSVYYNGAITELEYVNDDPKKDFKASDNVVAFISLTGELRVFYNGEIFPLLLINEAINYQAGKNIVPYIDGYTSTFKAFYKGNTYELAQNKPLSYKTGDDMVAFETNDWTFNIFYNQRITKLSSYQPMFYEVTDSLVIFPEFNQFKVFYKGKIHTLETNFIPADFKADFGTLIYFDQQQRLTVFSGGKKQIITYEPVSSYTLYRNAIHYKVNNADYVFWKGKSY